MDIAIPQLIFGSLIAGLVGSLIHLIFGGKILRLFFALIFSWIGFWAGHSIANRYGVFIFRFGTINVGLAITGALIIGFLGYWISGENSLEKEED